MRQSVREKLGEMVSDVCREEVHVRKARQDKCLRSAVTSVSRFLHEEANQI